MLLLSKLSHFHLMSPIFNHQQAENNKPTQEYVSEHNRQNSPNQNICSQTLSKLARFPEPGNKFANMAAHLKWVTLLSHFCLTPIWQPI